MPHRPIPAPDPYPLGARARGDWVRLRTLIVLRWIAIAGQVIALTVASRTFVADLDIGLCAVAIGAAVVANLIATFAYPKTKRLSETEAMLTQLFDIVQLAFLIYLTGGLHNPFALLIIVPVTISATALELRSTLFLGAVAAMLVTLLAFWHVPLTLKSGEVLDLPALHLFGFWLAIQIGLVFLAGYAYRITEEIHSMADALAATQMALAREQKLTDLGGVVAAAAHELGTPLATIKLVSGELMEELDGQPELLEDARLIREQADRCRDILQSMGRAGKDDLMMRSAPLSAVLREAAEPHQGRGKEIVFEVAPGPGSDQRQPSIHRRPEVIHGLRNLVQNAVDFAEGRVWVSAGWSDAEIVVRIADDGPGFPPQLIGRIGDPFVRRREAASEDAVRPEYRGMGLGLFIAKTLLERSGARLAFWNGSDPFLSDSERPERRGAAVEVVWPRAALAAQEPGREGGTRAGLGENRPIRA
ncbi:MAG: ActS/PrrB/RegB family redox-sensitive histidine kinase [Rhodobacteraceae bacterium]|jgi:two-component system sensor histidine kinase RegB|nr:ActS/PrrB/RegB family redox-sensitive histidine kinase [Paracoccaceae bacterium]